MVFMDIVREKLNHLHVSRCVCACAPSNEKKCQSIINDSGSGHRIGIFQNLAEIQRINTHIDLYLYLYRVDG